MSTPLAATLTRLFDEAAAGQQVPAQAAAALALVGELEALSDRTARLRRPDPPPLCGCVSCTAAGLRDRIATLAREVGA